MSRPYFPFAVRLIGFSEQEQAAFESIFATEQGKGYGYFALADDNLQDPNLYLVNADDLKALAALPSMHPSVIRPALLVGVPKMDLPFPCVERPICWPKLFEVLDELVERRADALSRLQASDIVIVPERRRRARLDSNADPAEYERMRVKRPDQGAVLVVDKTPALRDFLAELLTRHNVPVVWTDSEDQALDACRQQVVAVAMINTSAQEVDPYRLCWAIKEKDAPAKSTVMLLVGNAAEYDMQQARHVGADGYLIKPLAPQHMLSALKKFMPFLR
ncbi:response regulator [Noviherbaspirillum cavernae]|uniref:Response regulator n=1 Tax=Noviherbaspirillum cavernae TaxID=2320862 RepID=A0A418WZC2_9BURK|nr:response regulator [Noviherbaspirillum cavernae]RJG05425.1 response regulator [Noviherbaspirillum cavernae]